MKRICRNQTQQNRAEKFSYRGRKKKRILPPKNMDTRRMDGTLVRHL
jgi:hypothetical protein